MASLGNLSGSERGIALLKFADGFKLHVQNRQVMAQRIVHLAGNAGSLAGHAQFFDLYCVALQLRVSLLKFMFRLFNLKQQPLGAVFLSMEEGHRRREGSNKSKSADKREQATYITRKQAPMIQEGQVQHYRAIERGSGNQGKAE